MQTKERENKFLPNLCGCSPRMDEPKASVTDLTIENAGMNQTNQET